MKVAISYYFETIVYPQLLDGTILIDGKGGPYSLVSNVFHLTRTHYATVRRVVDETIIDIYNDKTYTPFRPVPNRKNTKKIFQPPWICTKLQNSSRSAVTQTTAKNRNIDNITIVVPNSLQMGWCKAHPSSALELKQPGISLVL